jgi:hypothetical protein
VGTGVVLIRYFVRREGFVRNAFLAVLERASCRRAETLSQHETRRGRAGGYRRVTEYYSV